MSILPEISENDIVQKLKEHKEANPMPQTPSDSGASALLYNIREEAKIAQAEELAEKQKTRTAKAEAERLEAEKGTYQARASISQAIAEQKKAEVEVLRADIDRQSVERERNVQEFMRIHGCSEDVARASLGYRTAVIPIASTPVPPTEVKSESAAVAQFLDTFTKMRQMEATMEQEIRARLGIGAAQPVSQQQLQQVVSADTLLTQKLNEQIALQETLKRLGAVLGLRPVEDTPLPTAPLSPPQMINLQDLSQVPASIAPDLWKIDREHRARLREIELRHESEMHKWSVIEGIKETVEKNLDFKQLGRMFAKSKEEEDNQVSVAVNKKKESFLRIECPDCYTPTILATQKMIVEGADASCTSCKGTWPLVVGGDDEESAEVTDEVTKEKSSPQQQPQKPSRQPSFDGVLVEGKN